MDLIWYLSGHETSETGVGCIRSAHLSYPLPHSPVDRNGSKLIN